MPFLLHHGSKTWEMEELTGDEIVALETRLGVRYFELDPGLKARDTLAILATFLMRDRDEAAVEKIIKRLTYKDMVTPGKIWSYQDESSLPPEYQDGLPKAASPDTSGTTTPSSSPASRGAGPRQSRGSKRSGT